MPDVMLSESERAVIRDVLAPFAALIERVGVFGSRATGRARPESDIDLVIYGDLDEAALGRILTRFDESLLPVTVDLVVYERLAYEPMKRHIDAVMQPIFERADLIAAGAA